MLGPVLVGQQVRLEPLTPEHLPSYVRWFADPEVTAYLNRTTAPTLKDEEEWLDRTSRSETDLVWAVALLDGTHLGSVGIHKIDWQHRHGITGTVIGEKTAWHKGYGGEAIALRTRYAFQDMGLEKLITYVWLDNPASRRALERVGYRQAGVHRHHVFRHGRWNDVWIGELLRQDWLAAQAEAPGS